MDWDVVVNVIISIFILAAVPCLILAFAMNPPLVGAVIFAVIFVWKVFGNEK